MTCTTANNANNQAARLEAAIAAQESLRASLDADIVDETISALRRQLEIVRGEIGRPITAESGHLATRALASLRSHLPDELAAKAQAIGSGEGEHKQVTVLFADLSGFTAISEHANREVIRDFQQDLFRDLARIIYQHEGFVEKFVGDAVLAVFGAPVAHEDDPDRALRVALAMRERMAVLNRSWSERLGTSVTLHVGINTGSVVAGKIGSPLDADGGAYAVTGDTVNSAARLQNAAQPGQILVSRTTYRLAQEAFTFQALEPIQVKNRREPLAVYELVRARSLPGKVRGIQELAQAFVGRDDTLAELEAVTNSFSKGAVGQIVLITGEAGIGKSRLVAEWRKRSGDRVLWIEGRCFSHTQMLSYGPFLDLLRRYCGIVDDDSDRRVRQRLDAAAERLFPGKFEARAILANLLAMRLRRDETVYLGKMSARELRERVFSLAERLFRNLALSRPLVLFLDDMQWADQTTLELIEHLLVAGDSQPIAVVMAARPDQESSLTPLEPKLHEQHRHRTVRVGLDRLDDSASGAMVRELLSVEKLPPKLMALISRKAEGNPFFVEEIIRALIERGALQREGGTWVTTPLMETITVPDTLQGLIMARIDRLPDETRDVVQHAAVIGRTFLYRVLLAIARSSPSLDADLTHLERSALIVENTSDPEVEYTFRHALTQDVAYESLLSGRRRELHLRVGEAMERIFASRIGEYYSIVAEHYTRGGDWDNSAKFHLSAGQQASQLFATAEARSHFKLTLDALDDAPRRTLEVKRRVIDATVEFSREVLLGEGYADDIEICLSRLKAAESLIRTLSKVRDDQLRAARVYGWLAQAHSMHGDLVSYVSGYVGKIQALDATLEPEIAARVGQVFIDRGLFDQAKAVLKPAISPLVRANLLVEWVHANGALAVAEAGSGQYSAGLERAEGGVQRAGKFPGHTLSAPANNYLGTTLLMGGDWRRAHQIYAQNEKHVKNMGHPAALAILDTILCGAYARRGEHELDHKPEMNKVLDDLAKPTGGTHSRANEQLLLDAWHEAFHAQMALHCGDVQKAESSANAALEAARKRGDVFGEGLAVRILAQTLAATDPDKGNTVDNLMRQSRDMLSGGGCVLEEARTQAAWGELQLKRGNLDGKDRLRDALRTFEGAGLTWEASRIRPLI